MSRGVIVDLDALREGRVVTTDLRDSHEAAARRVAARLGSGLSLRPVSLANPHADPRSYELVTETGVVLYVLTARAATGGGWRWHTLATLQPSDLDGGGRPS